MTIAAIIIHYGKKSTTTDSLTKLRDKLAGIQLILINNTPEDISDLVKAIPNTQLIDNRQNVGFAKAVNQGITLALADPSVSHVLLLNNDLHLSFGSIRELVRTFGKYSTAGIVSPILHHSGGFDWGGKFSRLTGLVRHTNWPNPPKTILSVNHTAGAAMLISRALIDKIGQLDERFFLYYEDLDYCLRTLNAGFTIHINPAVVAEHSVSAGSNLFRRTLHQWRSHILFVTKHLPTKVWPTAILTDLIFYPLLVLKSSINR